MSTVTTKITVVKNYLLNLQQKICSAIENQDGTVTFQTDEWRYEQGGGGISRVLENGPIIEKAGVNFSHVNGLSLPPSATEKRPFLSNSPFSALGISLVIHPRNPFVPTTHMNLRFFAANTENKEITWFGGGFDLTPYYGFTEDCIHWHKTAQKACMPFGQSLYERFKNACDDYFYLKHRKEPRGIGGLFFDDFFEGGFEHSFALAQSIGDHFLQAYIPILNRRKSMSYTTQHRDFQCYRRGRYVEFNLIYDRGTLFGLQSNGRTESILMSLPPLVSWQYNWKPSEGSEEQRLYTEFLMPRNWVDYR